MSARIYICPKPDMERIDLVSDDFENLKEIFGDDVELNHDDLPTLQAMAVLDDRFQTIHDAVLKYHDVSIQIKY